MPFPAIFYHFSSSFFSVSSSFGCWGYMYPKKGLYFILLWEEGAESPEAVVFLDTAVMIFFFTAVAFA